MMGLEIALLIVIIAIGVVAWHLGRRTGFEDGYERGFVAGKTEGIQTWQRTMETRRGPDGKDAFLGIR